MRSSADVSRRPPLPHLAALLPAFGVAPSPPPRSPWDTRCEEAGRRASTLGIEIVRRARCRGFGWRRVGRRVVVVVVVVVVVGCARLDRESFARARVTLSVIRPLAFHEPLIRQILPCAHSPARSCHARSPCRNPFPAKEINAPHRQDATLAGRAYATKGINCQARTKALSQSTAERRGRCKDEGGAKSKAKRIAKIPIERYEQRTEQQQQQHGMHDERIRCANRCPAARLRACRAWLGKAEANNATRARKGGGRASRRRARVRAKRGRRRSIAGDANDPSTAAPRTLPRLCSRPRPRPRAQPQPQPQPRSDLVRNSAVEGLGRRSVPARRPRLATPHRFATRCRPKRLVCVSSTAPVIVGGCLVQTKRRGRLECGVSSSSLLAGRLAVRLLRTCDFGKGDMIASPSLACDRSLASIVALSDLSVRTFLCHALTACFAGCQDTQNLGAKVERRSERGETGVRDNAQLSPSVDDDVMRCGAGFLCFVSSSTTHRSCCRLCRTARMFCRGVGGGEVSVRCGGDAWFHVLARPPPPPWWW